MELECDADDHVMTSTATFAQLSVSTLKALQQLILLHEKEVATLRKQMVTAVPHVCEGDTPPSRVTAALLGTECKNIVFPAAAGFNPTSSWQPRMEEADVTDAAPPPPCGTPVMSRISVHSDSCDSSATKGASEEVQDGPLSGSDTVSMKTDVLQQSLELQFAALEEETPWQEPGPSRSAYSGGRQRASMSSLQDFGSGSMAPFTKSRAFHLKTQGSFTSMVNILKVVLRSRAFEFACCSVILLDCVVLGLTVDIALNDGTQRLKDGIYGLECLLTGLFVLELIGKWALFETGLTWSWASLANAKIQLTETIVTLLSNVLVSWVLVPSGLSHYSLSSSGSVLQLLMCGRFLRLGRFYRLGKQSRICRDIFVFLRGISGSSVTFLWAIVLLLGFTFAFGVIGVVTISSPMKELLRTATDPADIALLQHLVDNFVGTLPLMMYTLSKILTGQITSSTFLADIDRFLDSAWLFWQAYLALTQLLLMNLITATLVDNAIGYQQAEAAEQREAQAAQEAKRRLKELRDLFLLMDENGDGTLSWAEIKQGLKNAEIRTRWKALNIQPDEAKTCFRLLDSDGVGEVRIEAFFEALQRMNGVAKSEDLLKTFTMVHDMQRSLKQLQRSLGAPPMEPPDCEVSFP